MTVCVATISANGSIIGAADRMLTGGDVEFEPSFPADHPHMGKIFGLTSSIFAMTAGDSHVQAEIMMTHVFPTVDAMVKKNPKLWLSVDEVVNIYCDAWNLVRHKRVERAVLSPFGLTHETFLSAQKSLSVDFLSKITRSMADYSFPPTATIIMGTESFPASGGTRPRLYEIHGDEAMCCDSIGFSAIGSGARHAESHLMLMRHSRSTPEAEGLFSTYFAKRKAEIAPGVGKDTDMFFIGNQLGQSMWLTGDMLAALEKTYSATVASQKASMDKGNAEVQAWLNNLSNPKSGTQQNQADK